MSFNLRLTISQKEALSYIGRNRKTGPKIGKGTPCSEYMLRKLKNLGLVMQVDDIILLTYLGERHFTKMHPHSKYRVR